MTSPKTAPPTVEILWEFPDRQVTGVAVSSDGRVFVNFPLWGGHHDLSVVELTADGMVPYPSSDWNSWTLENPIGSEQRFVCVQSVYVDSDDVLWILDPASPGFQGVVADGAKLVAVDLATDTVLRVYPFDEVAAPNNSYLNDVRVDTATQTAYITDSSLGALLVVDLEIGTARRVLASHPALRAEPEVVPVVGGRELRLPSGDVPRIHSDGIALDRRSGTLYLHALTARRLWSVPTAALSDPTLDDEALARELENLGETVMTDGMIIGLDGEVYHSAIEQDAVVAYRLDGTIEVVVSHPLLSWPDSFALSRDGWLYVTTSRIHEAAVFGGRRTEPYRVVRIKLEQ